MLSSFKSKTASELFSSFINGLQTIVEHQSGVVKEKEERIESIRIERDAAEQERSKAENILNKLNELIK